MLKSHITFLPSASARALKRQEEIKKIAIMVGVTNKELLLDDACLPFLFLPEQWKLKSVHTLYKEYLGWFTLLLKRNVLRATKTSCLSFLLFMMICVRSCKITLCKTAAVNITPQVAACSKMFFPLYCVFTALFNTFILYLLIYEFNLDGLIVVSLNLVNKGENETKHNFTICFNCLFVTTYLYSSENWDFVYMGKELNHWPCIFENNS